MKLYKMNGKSEGEELVTKDYTQDMDSTPNGHAIFKFDNYILCKYDNIY